MWGLRNLGKIKAVREIVKYIFSIIYKEGKVISIARGPLYGMRWHCHSAHQFWMPMGVYEKETAQWLSENINENDIFFDIGANAGYFTLLGSRHVGDGGKVISFDPIETNVETIKKHLDNNSTTNVVIERAAVSDYVGGPISWLNEIMRTAIFRTSKSVMPFRIARAWLACLLLRLTNIAVEMILSPVSSRLMSKAQSYMFYQAQKIFLAGITQNGSLARIAIRYFSVVVKSCGMKDIQLAR